MVPAWLRRQVGVVLQENVLLNRSVRDNIALAVPGAHEFILDLPFGHDTQTGERGAALLGGCSVSRSIS